MSALASGDLTESDLDAFGRPLFFAGHLAHHGCSRNEFYEFKASARALSERGCLMEHLGCKATQAIGDCNQRAWNGGGSCTHGGFACISCTSPGFEAARDMQVTPKIGGIPVGLPLDMPKAWFMTLAALSKSATPARVRQNAEADRVVVNPQKIADDTADRRAVQPRRGRSGTDARYRGRPGAQARVATTLYRGFEQILAGRPAGDALVIAPRICGICSVSQSHGRGGGVAAASAARGRRPTANCAANHRPRRREHRRPPQPFLSVLHAGFRARPICGAAWHADNRRALQGDRGLGRAATCCRRAQDCCTSWALIAGKWPHSLALQPGGVTRALDLGAKMRLFAILADFRAFCEKHLFGAPLEEIAAMETPGQLWTYANRQSDFASFLRVARDLRLSALGRCALPLLSFGGYHFAEGALFRSGAVDVFGAALPADGIGEQVASSWFADSAEDPARASTIPDLEREGAYSFAKAPRLRGRPAETGAVARQAAAGNPLIRALLAQGGASNVLVRVVARVQEIALLTLAAQKWARALNVHEAFSENAAAAAGERRGRGHGRGGARRARPLGEF